MMRGAGLLISLTAFRNAYLLRSALLWMGARVALAFGKVIDPGVLAEVTLVAIVAVVLPLDARRRNEDLFLGNLGIPSWSVAALAVPMPALLELLVP